MNARPENLVTTLENVWRCYCGRLRASPYAPMHLLCLAPYVGCGSCGEACIDESDARSIALKAAVEKHLV